MKIRYWYKRLCAICWIIYRDIGQEIDSVHKEGEQGDYEDGFCICCGNDLPWCKCEQWASEFEELA